MSTLTEVPLFPLSSKSKVHPRLQWGRRCSCCFLRFKDAAAAQKYWNERTVKPVPLLVLWARFIIHLLAASVWLTVGPLAETPDDLRHQSSPELDTTFLEHAWGLPSLYEGGVDGPLKARLGYTSLACMLLGILSALTQHLMRNRLLGALEGREQGVQTCLRPRLWNACWGAFDYVVSYAALYYISLLAFSFSPQADYPVLLLYGQMSLLVKIASVILWKLNSLWKILVVGVLHVAGEVISFLPHVCSVQSIGLVQIPSTGLVATEGSEKSFCMHNQRIATGSWVMASWRCIGYYAFFNLIFYAVLCCAFILVENYSRIQYIMFEEAKRRAFRERNLRNKAIRTMQQKNELQDYVFHEIRVPFNTISVGLENLQDWSRYFVKREREEFVESVHLMVAACRSMSTVLDDMLDMSRIDQGRFKLYPEPFSLTHLVHAVKPLHVVASSRQVALDITYPNTSMPLVADSTRLVQVLLNLVSNAIKFSPPGTNVQICFGVRVMNVGDWRQYQSHMRELCEVDACQDDRTDGGGYNTSATVEVLEQDQWQGWQPTNSTAEDSHPAGNVAVNVDTHMSLPGTVGGLPEREDSVGILRFWVADDGPGVPVEDRQHIFTAFGQSQSGAKQSSSSGLGLFIARNICLAHGGLLYYCTAQGSHKGAKFVVEIPFYLRSEWKHEDSAVGPEHHILWGPLNPAQGVQTPMNSPLHSIRSFMETKTTVDPIEGERAQTASPSAAAFKSSLCMPKLPTLIQNKEPPFIGSLDSGGESPKFRGLVVDDDKGNRVMMTRMLKTLNVDAASAANGIEGLQVLGMVERSNKWVWPYTWPSDMAIVFLDNNMPEMDGFSMLKCIRSAGLTVPVIILTGSASSAERRKFIDNGATNVLLKPISRATLKQVVEKTVPFEAELQLSYGVQT